MFRIFGPPGTGKTTTLLNMVEKQMEDGILPSQIGFLAFTRKAAREARERFFTYQRDAHMVFCRYKTKRYFLINATKVMIQTMK